jgi:hypothetical protein
MLTSAAWSFTDPDEYALHARATRMEIAVTRPGCFAAKTTRIDLHRMWLQRFSDNLPRVAHFNHSPGRAIISFRTHAGPDILWDGKVEPIGLARHPECFAAFQRSSGPAHWGSLSLPIEDMAIVGETSGGEFTPPKELLYIVARPAALTRLLELHAAAGLLVRMPLRLSPTPKPRAASSRHSSPLWLIAFPQRTKVHRRSGPVDTPGS